MNRGTAALTTRRTRIVLTSVFTSVFVSVFAGASAFGSAVEAQGAPRLQMMRCGPRYEAACLAIRLVLPPNAFVGTDPTAPALRWSAQLAGVGMIGPDQPRVSGVAQPNVTPVFGVPVLPSSSLGRNALTGTVVLKAANDTLLRIQASWRPPLLSLPAFVGVVDSASLPTALREALAVGAAPSPVRLLLASALALTGILIVAFIPRVLWSETRESVEDMAQEVAAARALLSTQELEQVRGKAPREVKPRTAEEPTRDSGMRRPEGP